MANIGIDWVAMAIVGAALIIGQIRQIPAAIRYFIMAAAFGIVAIYRLNTGGTRDNFNLVVIALCVVFAIQNVVKGMRYRPPTSDS